MDINKFTKKVEIAKPIINFENDDILLINKNNSEIYYYYFSIINFNGDYINEIKLKYDLELQCKLYDSIEIKLYKNDELIKLNNNKLFNNEIKNNIKQRDNYILEIIYNEELNIKKEDIKENIKIIISAQQL